MSRLRHTFLVLAFAISAPLMVLAGIPRSQAAGDDASQILKAMSDYLASQKTISAAFDSALEVMTPQGEKIQFNSSGTLLLQRPKSIKCWNCAAELDLDFNITKSGDVEAEAAVRAAKAAAREARAAKKKTTAKKTTAKKTTAKKRTAQGSTGKKATARKTSTAKNGTAPAAAEVAEVEAPAEG